MYAQLIAFQPARALTPKVSETPTWRWVVGAHVAADFNPLVPMLPLVTSLSSHFVIVMAVWSSVMPASRQLRGIAATA